MKIRVAFLSFLIFCTNCCFAQTPDSSSEIGGDTIETIISDTSIIYVIRAAPVKVIEKIEVVKPKAKSLYYLSNTVSLLYFLEFKKALPQYEEYLSKLNSVTKNQNGYSIGTSIWKCPQKTFTALSITYLRLKQSFNYSNQVTYVNYKINNYFNYLEIGIHIGYILKKTNRISYIISGGIHGCNTLSYSSKTLNKLDPTLIANIKDEIKYREFLMNMSLNLKLLFTTKNINFEVEPFILISPISATIKNEAYSIKRSVLGIKVGLNHKLF